METEPMLYLVRIWPADGSDGFRASARAADAEDALPFDEPTALLAFLLARPAPSPQPREDSP